MPSPQPQPSWISRLGGPGAGSPGAQFPPADMHFIGIGGIGMSALARLCQARGARVTGSDLATSGITRDLETSGIPVRMGHAPEHLGQAEVVVYSSAVAPDNCELAAARRRGLKLLPRTRLLGRLMREFFSIAVCGAHGKSTTTWLIAHLLIQAGGDPTVLLGGLVSTLGGNFRQGKSPLLVVELDESDGIFVETRPDIAVLTNIDREHLDHYTGIAHITATFRRWIQQVPAGGTVVGCGDDPLVRVVLQDSGRRTIFYGTSPECEVRAGEIKTLPGGMAFRLQRGAEAPARVFLPMPGEHNVLNALACAAVAGELGVGEETLLAALAVCPRVGRRYEIKGHAGGVCLIDDYGHHPTEIKATLRAARAQHPGRLIVVFQPHRYSRTRALLEEFGRAFFAADRLIVMEVYSAGESPLPGVDGKAVTMAAADHPHSRHLADPAAVVAHLLEIARPGDLVLTMGAGDVYRVGEMFLAEAKRRWAA